MRAHRSLKCADMFGISASDPSVPGLLSPCDPPLCRLGAVSHEPVPSLLQRWVVLLTSCPHAPPLTHFCSDNLLCPPDISLTLTVFPSF